MVRHNWRTEERSSFPEHGGNSLRHSLVCNAELRRSVQPTCWTDFFVSKRVVLLRPPVGRLFLRSDFCAADLPVADPLRPARDRPRVPASRDRLPACFADS